MAPPSDLQNCLICRRARVTCIVLEVIWLAVWLYIGGMLFTPNTIHGWVWRTIIAVVWFMVLVTVVIVLMLAVYLYFAHYHSRTVVTDQEPASTISVTERTLPPMYYVCPACGKEFTQPGRCPVDFIPLKDVDPVEDRKFEEL